MKILFLSPLFDAGHSIVKQLQEKGVACLLTADSAEAWQMLQLHGTSVDLAVVQREGMGRQEESGLRFIERVKADPVQSDLPMVLTSQKWGDADFVRHQNGRHGVNGYLNTSHLDELLSIIEAVLGGLGNSNTSSSISRPIQGFEKQPPAATPDSSERSQAMVLEDPGSMYKDKTGSNLFHIELQGGSEKPGTLTSIPAAGRAPGATEETSAGLDMSGVELPPLPIAGMEPTRGKAPEALSPTIASPTLAGADPFQETGTIGKTKFVSSGAAGDGPSVLLGGEQSSLSSHRGPAENEPSILGSAQPSTNDSPEGFPEALKDDLKDLESELPYLFSGASENLKSSSNPEPVVTGGPAFLYSQPLGDAVVPGGAFNAPDLETLKKYLLLREQDVAALSAQLQTAREQVHALEERLKSERGHASEYEVLNSEQKRKIEDFEKDKQLLIEGMQAELNELRFQMKSKMDKARVLDVRVRETSDEMDRLKERVRSDIRKIRVREKELENRLEIMKKDSEALLSARETKIVELKRKLDLLEFNMDLLQDQYMREKDTSARLRENLLKASQAVRVAGGLLDPPARAKAAKERQPSESDEGEEAS